MDSGKPIRTGRGTTNNEGLCSIPSSFAISMVFAKCNNQTNVPSPSECLKVASENNLVDSIINIAANCLNSAISAEKTIASRIIKVSFLKIG